MSTAVCSHAAAARGVIELADVFERYGAQYAEHHSMSSAQRKVVRAILRCRTAALGGHRDWCPRCGYERYIYHSCRNRHCPKCQTLAKAQWLEDRRQELLPVPYFHNVFTLPHDLNPLILYSERNRRALWGLLFQAAAETLLAFGRNNLGGRLGITMVLHTWDQQLRPHFHVHCVIAGGALAEDGSRWIPAAPNFLFPVRALSQVFRGKYLAGLRQLLDRRQLDVPSDWAEIAGGRRLPRGLRRKPWVVYCKAPFAGPDKLLDYLGRYTHRVAISSHRLLACDDGQVRFTYRDRRDGNRQKVLSLPADEFIARFLKHVLPSGFMRIRHYGLLANRHKQTHLAFCRQHLEVERPPSPALKTLVDWLFLLTGQDVTRCPQCGHQPLACIEIPAAPLQPAASPHGRNVFW